jgi:hypothetical protein
MHFQRLVFENRYVMWVNYLLAQLLLHIAHCIEFCSLYARNQINFYPFLILLFSTYECKNFFNSSSIHIYSTSICTYTRLDIITGTVVMILKYFRQKWANNWRFCSR